MNVDATLAHNSEFATAIEINSDESFLGGLLVGCYAGWTAKKVRCVHILQLARTN